MAEQRAVTDTALIERCRRSDATAWEILVQRYQRLVYSIPRRAGLDDDQAADVFQHVFVALFEHLDRLEHPEKLAGWLATTARRETWRVSRAQRATGTLPHTDDERDHMQETLVDTALLPDEQLEQLEQQHAIRRAVYALDDRCRELLTLLFYQVPPPAYTEVAAALQMSVGSIGPVRARCLQKLRQVLAQRGY